MREVHLEAENHGRGMKGEDERDAPGSRERAQRLVQEMRAQKPELRLASATF